jgi:phosphate-selective porin OprO and OprP
MFFFRRWITATFTVYILLTTSVSAEAKPEGKSPAEDRETITEELLRRLNEEGRLSDESTRTLQERIREEEKKGAQKEWEFKWKNGLKFSRRDNKHSLAITGQIQNDWALIDYDSETAQLIGIDDEDLHSGTEFRRMRIAFSGNFYQRFDFKTQVDFSGGSAEFKDVWVAIRDLGPLGKLTIGQVKEPFSIESLMGSKHTTFMERGLPNVFFPDRGTGFLLSDAPRKGRLTWAIGGFRSTNDVGRDISGDVAYNVTGRLTGLPVYQNGGAQLLHVGVSYSHQFRSGLEEVRYRARPESNLSERLVNTRTIDTRGQDLFGFELAHVLGPFSMQGEVVGSVVNDRDGKDLVFWGAYGLVSVFLTGEHREFDRESGTFDRVEPNRSPILISIAGVGRAGN